MAEPEIDVDETFSLAPVQFQTDISNICALEVRNDVLVVGFKSGELFRIDLNNPTVIETLQLPFKRSAIAELGKIEKLFLDPTGNHLVVSTAKNENFYIHKKCKQFKHINELKGCKVNAVGWNLEAVNDVNTGPLLIGDKTGAIYECYFEYQEKNQKYVKKISKVSYHLDHVVDGIDINYNVDTNELIILLVGGDDIVYWCEQINKNKKPTDLLYGSIMKMSPIEKEKYQDLGNINGTKFSCFQLEFGWLTNDGIVFGSISPDRIKHKQKNFNELKFLLNVELPESTHKCKSIVLSKYHLMVLRGKELMIINKLSDELVYHQILPTGENERLIGLSADYLKNTYWLYSDCNIYEISVTNEERNIWKLMIENNEFDEALKITEDVAIRDIIFTKKGDHLLKLGDGVKAAKSYAKSSVSFETIALKFLENSNNQGLLEYFIEKFYILKYDKNFDFKMQQVMLSSWIVELFIEQLNDIDDKLTTEQISKLPKITELKISTEKRFQEFLVENKSSFDKETIYEIITSHNRRSELLYYANLIGDYDFVLAYWVRLENWKESLKIMERNKDLELVYKYSTVLLVNSPELTVDTWLSMENIDPTKLLPSILTYHNNSKKVKPYNNHALRYLNEIIKTSDHIPATVHDTLLYILISNEIMEANDEDTILIHLEKTGGNFEFNSDFILRLCLRFNKIKSAIFIYSSLNFYEDALNLALKHDLLDSAVIVADKPNDNKTRKFLWLKIAKAKINKIRPSDKNEISKQIKFLLSNCELLSIKDLLPIIPDFTTIDNLKDEICSDLEKFGSIINNLTLEMNSSITINESIVKEISEHNERDQVIKPGESCASCELLLTTRKFFVFPCSHCFHSDCLVKLLLQSNDYSTKKRIEFLQKKYLQSKPHGKNEKFINSPEVDELLSRRCPLCSDISIDMVDQPFIDPHEKQTAENDWDI